MVCHKFNGNPCAEPCEVCKRKYIVTAETRNEDFIACCFDNYESAKRVNAIAEVKNILAGVPILPKSNILLVPKKEVI